MKERTIGNKTNERTKQKWQKYLRKMAKNNGIN
jgi:hypothetical protein